MRPQVKQKPLFNLEYTVECMATEKDPISKSVTLWISGKYTRLTFLPGITPFAQLPSVPYVPGPIPFNITYMQLFSQTEKAR